MVTRPDRAKGRGRQVSPPPVAVAAREHGLRLEQPADVHELDLAGSTTSSVCAFGALISEPLLSHPGLINVHPSLLPRWRGAAPLERAIMAGDAETGVCIMKMVEELDAGAVCLVERTPIGPDDTYGDVSGAAPADRAAAAARGLASAPPAGSRPPTGWSTPRRSPARTARSIRADGRGEARVVRALSPHIGAKAGDLGVWAARAAESAPPGEIRVEDGRVLWGCAGGALELLEVQPPGKRRMAARRLRPGAMSTPRYEQIGVGYAQTRQEDPVLRRPSMRRSATPRRWSTSARGRAPTSRATAT